MDLNRAMVIGNVTKDPELRVTGSGQSVASFGLATNQYYTDKDGNKQTKAEYHNIVLWGKLAELANQLLRKGSKCYVEGRMQTREWDAQDGAKRNRTEIVAENFINLAPKDHRSTLPARPEPDNTADFVHQSMEKQENTSEIRLEDIPF